jgi:hypothetical protein
MVQDANTYAAWGVDYVKVGGCDPDVGLYHYQTQETQYTPRIASNSSLSYEDPSLTMWTIAGLVYTPA